MSSLLAHVAAGATLYFRQNDQTREASRANLAVLVLLAIMPDFDYFAIWFLRLRFEQRFTHSILFCLMTSMLVWLFRNRWPHRGAPPLRLTTLLLAACSHLLLDMMVGRSLPLFWPFFYTEYSLPFAILPGAAHTGLASYVFWRQLVLESCILLPTCAAIILTSRQTRMRTYAPEFLLGLAMGAGLMFCCSITGR